jgi:hypothetical protein
MDYGLPQEYYKKKFDAKLERRPRRYRDLADPYVLGQGLLSQGSLIMTTPPAVVVAGPLPDPQIFFTEPSFKPVKTLIQQYPKLSVNISGEPALVDQIESYLNTLQKF